MGIANNLMNISEQELKRLRFRCNAWCYPKMNINISDEGIETETYFRIKHEDGVWYFVRMIERSVWPSGQMKHGIKDHMLRFQRNLYTYQKFYIIDPSMTDYQGWPVYIPDDSLDSEEERLAKLLAM